MVDRLIISDIDHTLIGDASGLNRFLNKLKKTHANVGFGIATGRRLESAVDILKKSKVHMPDIFITSVGSEINYGKSMVEDRTWKHHLNYFWEPERVREALAKIEGLESQEQGEQILYKISYNLVGNKAPSRRKIVKHLRNERIRVKYLIVIDQFILSCCVYLLPYFFTFGNLYYKIKVKYLYPITQSEEFIKKLIFLNFSIKFFL